MEQRSIFSYYAFGYNYGVLTSLVNGESNREQTITHLDGFLGKITELKLPVSSKIAAPLKDILGDLRESEDSLIGPDCAKNITEVIGRVDASLDAELQLKRVFLLTEKRYELEKLLNTPSQLLGEGIYQRLSEFGAKDFALACQQIALAQATSAAFHLMRSLEAEVKSIYFAFKKTNRLAKPMWGPMTDELRKKNKPKPSVKLLDHLDSMRRHFRNPTQHPESYYSIDEAQDLLNQTITAINMIHAEMPVPKIKNS